MHAAGQGLWVAAAVWAGCVVAPAMAQTVPGQVDRDAQRLQEVQQQQLQERSEQFDNAQARPPGGREAPKEPPTTTVGGGCAAIREVKIAGMSRYRPDAFAEVVAGLKGQCVGVDRIDAALRAITDRYVKDGYITSRAFVGPQDLRAGVLTVTVIEGRVAKVQGKGKAYGPGELGAAFPGEQDRLLNLRALEQGVDQLARLGRADPGIAVAPGEMAGTSIVEVAGKPIGWWLRPNVGIDDRGPTMTGRWQASAGLDADSLLGIADVWSLYYQRSAVPDPSSGMQAYGGFMSIPHGWWSLSLGVGASDYHTVLSGNGLSFVSTGKSWNGSATLERMLHRNAVTKLSASVGLALIDTRNFIEGIELRTGSYRIATANVAVRWQWRASKRTQVSATLGYSRGLGILGANAVDTGPGGPVGQADIFNATVSEQTSFVLGRTKFVNTTSLRGQWGLENLFPMQRLSLGGGSTVAGFWDQGISGRSGALLREQMAVGVADLAKKQPWLATSLSVFAGYDIGGVLPGHYDLYERGMLQALSVGVRAQGRHLQVETMVAVPVMEPGWVGNPGTTLTLNLRIVG